VRGGEFVYAPAGTEHAFHGVSDMPARLPIFDAPAHTEAFFREIDREIRDLPRDLSGKRVLVTGVSAGLGVETARALAAHGAIVVGAARDLDKAERATEPGRAAAAGGGSIVTKLSWMSDHGRLRSRHGFAPCHRLPNRSGRARRRFRWPGPGSF
jgi:hypothetical protein